MDVKAGSGAFMARDEEARALAESIVTVANAAGLPTRALLTDMDAPLACAAGNAVEVAYAVDYLTGRTREPRFHAVTMALCVEMLVLGGLAADRGRAEARLQAVLDTGAAAETFARMVGALGGPSDILEATDRHLPRAKVVRPVAAENAGTVEAVDTRAVGLAVIGLGGGRTRPQDDIDPRVGFSDLARPGDRLGIGDPLGTVHAADARRRGTGGGSPSGGLSDRRDGTGGAAGDPRAGRLSLEQKGTARRSTRRAASQPVSSVEVMVTAPAVVVAPVMCR